LKYGTHEGACAAVESSGRTPREACGGSPEESESKPGERVQDPKTGRYIKLPPKPVDRPRDPKTGRYLIPGQKPDPGTTSKGTTRCVLKTLGKTKENNPYTLAFWERNKTMEDVPSVMKGSVPTVMVEQTNPIAAQRYARPEAPTQAIKDKMNTLGGFYERRQGEITILQGTKAGHGEWALTPQSATYGMMKTNPELAVENTMLDGTTGVFYHEYAHAMDDKMKQYAQTTQTYASPQMQKDFETNYEYFRTNYYNAFDAANQPGGALGKWYASPYQCLGGPSSYWARDSGEFWAESVKTYACAPERMKKYWPEGYDRMKKALGGWESPYYRVLKVEKARYAKMYGGTGK